MKESQRRAVKRLHKIDMTKPPLGVCYLDRYINAKFVDRLYASVITEEDYPGGEYHALTNRYYRNRNI